MIDLNNTKEVKLIDIVDIERAKKARCMIQDV